MEVATRIFLGKIGAKFSKPFQHLFFLMEVATLALSLLGSGKEYPVSTPFLPNGSRYTVTVKKCRL